jgi:hypothetical protein
MPPKTKRPSTFDRLRDALGRLLDDLGPWLSPPRLQPKPVPIRPAKTPRRR